MMPQKGKLEKLSWLDVREDVVKVNPELAKIIDEISPSNKYWIAKVTYPYGSLVMKKSMLQLPNKSGTIVPITDPSLDQIIQDGLGYNLSSNPVSLVLKNSFEIFLPLEDRTIPLGGLIKQGIAFGAWRVLNPKRPEQPAFLWDMTAGARSVFMLPKITEAKKHLLLKRAYNLTADVPYSLMGHWEVFHQLANSLRFEQPWEAEILFFSHQWFKHLTDNKWRPLYYYFHDAAWGGSELWRNQFIWDLIFSLILKNYETRLNADVMDTTKCLLYMGVGALSGLGPAKNNIAGPFSTIQKIYIEEYVSKYPPIIMQPETFNMYDPKANPVYYSLQFPSAAEFKPSSRVRTSLISDLHEIRSLMNRCKNELITDKYNLKGTSMSELFDRVEYDYFHNGVELHAGMRNSIELAAKDKYLITTIDGQVHDAFPDSCSFVKGCIRLSRKELT